MYRRLKNLLGVSLIIFAILLSQIPMPSVQADSTDEGQVTVTFEYGMSGLSPSVEKLTVAKGSTLGIDAMEISVDDGSRVALTENTTYSISGAHYIFKGWCSESAAGPKWDFATDTVTEDVTLFAVWDSVSDVEYDYDEVMNEVAVLDDDGNAVADATVTVTLRYGITGIADKEITVSSGAILTEDDLYIIQTPNYTLKEGESYSLAGGEYTFWGWYTQSNQKGSKWVNTAQVSKDITLYAAWSSTTTFNVTYHVDSDVTTKTAQAGKTIPEYDGTPAKPYYKFDKWIYIDNTEVDFSTIVSSDLDIYASWTAQEYQVTFHMNGGTYTASGGTAVSQTSMTLTGGNTIDTTAMEYPSSDNGKFEYSAYETDENWYIDQICLTTYDLTSAVSKDITLYKKWFYKDEAGFTLSADGAVLYLFDGTQESVTIPESVTVIAANAFADMKNIKQITLPPNIKYIAENAFSGMTAASFVERDIYLYVASNATSDTRNRASNLAQRYEHFVYKASSTSTDTDGTTITTYITCSLADIDRGTATDGTPLYPKLTMPYDLTKGSYTLTLAEDGTQVHIADLLAKAGYNTDSNHVYYMDIELKKSGTNEAYEISWNGTMTITMPLPKSWYGRDTSKIKMFAVSQDYEALDEVTTKNFSNNIFSFEPPHFSEYALVYVGNLDSNSTTDNNGNSSSNGGSSDGGSSSSDGGSSSSGGGGSSSDSSSSSSTASASSSSSAVASSTTASTADTTGTDAAAVQNTSADNSSNGTGTNGTGNNGGGHVKDATPKTGDPLEYRTLLVCGMFSLGVILLLIGNKKKASSFSQYRRA